MPEIIQCPSCQRELQVPEDFVGRPVKCPSCGVNFVTSAGTTAPLPAAPAPLHVSLPQSYAPGPVPGAYGSMTPSGTPGMVLAPGICLLVFGILCFLVDVLNLVVTLSPSMQPKNKEGLPPFLQQVLEDQEKNAGLQVTFAGLFLFASLVILGGAVQMLRMRTWGVALAGSIVAMLHLQVCCCLLGLPLGVWSVVVLCQPDVRALFK
jgi:hypothetical protein